MVVRHREFIHDFEARSPGREEQALRDRANAKPPVHPGHFNATLGTHVPVASKRNQWGTMTKANRKARVTLAKVW